MLKGLSYVPLLLWTQELSRTLAYAYLRGNEPERALAIARKHGEMDEPALSQTRQLGERIGVRLTASAGPPH